MADADERSSCRRPAKSEVEVASGVRVPRGVKGGDSETVDAIEGLQYRRLHEAFERDHAPGNWPVLCEALWGMGRADSIGQRPD